MVAINFQKQFWGDVEAGNKTQTIRREARCQAGDVLQLYGGQRTKQCRLLREAICAGVNRVTLTEEGPIFQEPGWEAKDKDLFAQKDGFPDYKAMYEWFYNRYREAEFTGYVIKWNPLPKQEHIEDAIAKQNREASTSALRKEPTTEEAKASWVDFRASHLFGAVMRHNNPEVIMQNEDLLRLIYSHGYMRGASR